MLRSRRTRKAAIIPNRIRSTGKLPLAPIIDLLARQQISALCPVTQMFSRFGRVAGRRPRLYGSAMILLRHGQSEFNLHFTATRRDPGIIDPRLTELGHLQAEAAATRLAGERITRIITSPYTRALQTAAPLARAFGATVLDQSDRAGALRFRLRRRHAPDGAGTGLARTRLLDHRRDLVAGDRGTGRDR